jgi:cytochrome P450
MILMNTFAANRDPAVYDDPARVDTTRESRSTLSHRTPDSSRAFRAAALVNRTTGQASFHQE